jgi:tryptophan synthase
MGYYNPILSYGEERLLNDAKEAGVSGFIIVDLPPEEAVRLRNHCTKVGLSYIPLISPATSDSRMKLLCKIADSWVYVVSRMGVTGNHGTLNADLPNLLERVHKYSGGLPAAVGFGVSTREHFLSVASIAEGVVIGSQIITEISKAAPGEEGQTVERYCRMVTGKNGDTNGLTREVGIIEALAEAKEPNGSLAQADKIITASETNGHTNDLVDQLEELNADDIDPHALSMRFGEYGGQYVPESLVDCLAELNEGFKSAIHDPKFWQEYESFYPYMGRPGHLQYANRLTDHAGGARIWLKREDLNHTVRQSSFLTLFSTPV